MKKLMLLAMAIMLSVASVNAAPYQDAKKCDKECCKKCDDKCKKECKDQCKDGKCTAHADCSKKTESNKDCCKKEKKA